jgi:alkaline phosphatase
VWQARHTDGAYVWNGEAFADLDPEAPGPVLGLFEPSHMRFEADRDDDPGAEPSLAEMTRFALAKLAHTGGRQGFLLVIEAGRIDHAHHAANAHRALVDTIALSDAVAVAREATSPEDTLIVVTADHGHTLTIGGYARRGNPILGKVRVHHPEGDPEGLLMPDASGLPFTTLTYANGPGHVAPSATQGAGAKRYPHRPGRLPGSAAARPDLADVDTTAPDYLQEGAVPLGSETHGGEDVPVYASGPGSQWVTGVLEQHVLFHAVREALRL